MELTRLFPIALVLTGCARGAGGARDPRTVRTCETFGRAAAIDGIAAVSVGTVLLVPADPTGHRRALASALLVGPGVAMLGAGLVLKWCVGMGSSR